VSASGRATPEATGKLAAQHAGAGFYRPGWDGLWVASLGLGTYLGEADDATDARYGAAIRRYWQLGGNLVDTAINYRLQRSERAIGAALQAALSAGEVRRPELILCTKGGYLAFDSAWPADEESWIRETYVDSGLVQPDEIVDGHCMAPAFLRHEIARSRENLRVDCIDLYYLHNPEAQRSVVGDEVFRSRLREAFAAFEVAIAQGFIGAYGAATWSSLRAKPQEPDYLPMQTLLEVARDVAGDHHHFRAVQLPLNFQMLEAVRRANQPGADGLAPVLQVAAEHQVGVVASASLLQSQVVGHLPDGLRAKFEPGLTDAQRALQFVRSAPGLTSALAGMSRVSHVEENLRLAQLPPMPTEAWQRVFRA
jgi:aryl-alcohol dehydrogenase-like predicted oxidoreductase